MRDFAHNIQVKRVLSPVATPADNTAQVGQIIDRLGYDSLTYVIATGAIPDVDATFTVLLEESDAANMAGAAAVADADMISQTAGTRPRLRLRSSSIDDNRSPQARLRRQQALHAADHHAGCERQRHAARSGRRARHIRTARLWCRPPRDAQRLAAFARRAHSLATRLRSMLHRSSTPAAELSTSPCSTPCAPSLASPIAARMKTSRDGSDRRATSIAKLLQSRVRARDGRGDVPPCDARERSSALALSRPSIASVVENDETLAATDYEVKRENGVLTRLTRRQSDMLVRRQDRRHVHGRLLLLLTDLPYGIERAAILLVNQYRYAPSAIRSFAARATEGAGSSSYFDGLEAGGMSPEVRGLLAEHRKPAGS